MNSFSFFRQVRSKGVDPFLSLSLSLPLSLPLSLSLSLPPSLSLSLSLLGIGTGQGPRAYCPPSLFSWEWGARNDRSLSRGSWHIVYILSLSLSLSRSLSCLLACLLVVWGPRPPARRPTPQRFASLVCPPRIGVLRVCSLQVGTVHPPPTNTPAKTVISLSLSRSHSRPSACPSRWELAPQSHAPACHWHKRNTSRFRSEIAGSA